MRKFNAYNLNSTETLSLPQRLRLQGKSQQKVVTQPVGVMTFSVAVIQGVIRLGATLSPKRAVTRMKELF